METNDSGELVATASDLLVHVAGSGSPVRVGTDITSLKLDLSVLSTMVTQTTLDLETDLLALNASINDAKSSVTDSSERTDGFINDLNTATSVLRTDVAGLVTKTDGIVRDAMAKTVELDDLRTFVLELADNHTDLNDHVTLNVSTLLSEALEVGSVVLCYCCAYPTPSFVYLKNISRRKSFDPSRRTVNRTRNSTTMHHVLPPLKA